MRALAAAVSEVGCWLRTTRRLVAAFPGQLSVLVASAWLAAPLLPVEPLLAGALGAAVLLRGWSVWLPYSFHTTLGGRAVRTYRRLSCRRRWPELANACGLGLPTTPLSHGSALDPRAVETPRLTRVSAEGPRVHLRLRPLMGQTTDDFVKAGEALRMAAAASRIRVEPYGVNEVVLSLTMGDPLAEPFAATRPTVSSSPRTDRVAMGLLEDGRTWQLPLGPHTLVAGSSGAGKGSVFWSFAFGLAPAVRAGLVRLHGIDLKGGMEILMGRELFTTRATDAEEAVALLEHQVQLMQERTRSYAGRLRAHTPTLDEPLHVVMVDELAALTAYCPERDLQRRAERAINLLCSQGRAPGFMVFACLQDPRKEVIPSRGLFTQMIGLRLKDASETAMVLGETAEQAGAHCHRISRSAPGMGYVVPEDGGYPVRVRAGFASDHAIRAVAAEYAAPNQLALPPLSDLPSPGRDSRRRVDTETGAVG